MVSPLHKTLLLSWVLLNGLLGQAPDPYGVWKTANGIASDMDDSDGDSIPAIMEYYSGTSPSRHDKPACPSIQVANGEVRLGFAHDPVVCDVTATLKQWAAGSGWHGVAYGSRHDGQDDTYRFTLAAQPGGIFRFEIEPGPNGHFLSGADISALKAIEDRGGVFKKNGAAGDAVGILRDEGINMFRIRIFVDPDGTNVVVNNLPYSLALAARIKAAGCGLMLDFHYSDTWADPGRQTKPAAWEGLGFEELKQEVEAYTASVIAAFAGQGTCPDVVQIGNEVVNGMIWPDGQLYTGNHAQQWVRFTDLLKAGIRGARKSAPEGHLMRIMIHIDKGGDWAATKWFFDKMSQYSVGYDIIGLSYYPWWHGALTQVATTFYEGARRYRKPMILVETAYPHLFEQYWSSQPNMAWDISESGQAAFLQDLASAVRQNAGSYGLGVFYWYPEAVPVPGLNVWNNGATALFGADGEVHAGASSMRPAP